MSPQILTRVQAFAVQVGEKLYIEVTVRQIKGPHVKFATACLSSDGRLLIDGEALAKLPSQSAWSPQA